MTKSTTLGAVTILSYYRAKSPTLAKYESALKAAGVSKSTISKTLTVLRALDAGTIQPEQVTSLSAAYELATNPPSAAEDRLKKVRDLLDQAKLDFPGGSKYISYGEFLSELEEVLG